MATSPGFGKEVFATDSIRPGRLVGGLVGVGQAAYRRLRTPRGTLLPIFGDADDAEYGLDLSAYVGRDPKNAEAALPGLIRAELLKDERITGVTVAIVKTVSGPATSFAITIRCETDDGAVTLTLAVSDVSPELLGITAEAA